MAILEIALFPERCLRNETEEITVFDDALKTLISDMAETMYEAPGIGLAGPQVRVMEQIFVLDVSDGRDDLRVFINPQIIASSGSQVYEEGCLSIPGIFEKVERPEFVTVKAQDQNGESFIIEADGLLAVCIQHEYDHLHGTLFLDHLSRLKKSRTIKKYEKKLNQPEL